MLKQLEISNFQSHKRTELELHPGINVIIGSSDVGKTAIIRALTWLIWNRPSGEAFQSSWGGETKVTAEIDKMKISRIKGSERNIYVLGVSEFHAIKTDVPVEVLQALNMHSVNVQRQFDRPFLLDESPGTVAAFFNTIAHLDVIDSVTQIVQRWIRQLENNIAADERRQIELTENLKEFDGLDDIEKHITVLEQACADIKKLIDNKSALQNLINSIEVTKIETLKHEQTLRLEGPVKDIYQFISERTLFVDRKQEIESLISRIKLAQSTIEKESKSVIDLQKKFTESFPDICPLCGRTNED